MAASVFIITTPEGEPSAGGHRKCLPLRHPKRSLRCPTTVKIVGHPLIPGKP